MKTEWRWLSLENIWLLEYYRKTSLTVQSVSTNNENKEDGLGGEVESERILGSQSLDWLWKKVKKDDIVKKKEDVSMLTFIGLI